MRFALQIKDPFAQEIYREKIIDEYALWSYLDASLSLSLGSSRKSMSE